MSPCGWGGQVSPAVSARQWFGVAIAVGLWRVGGMLLAANPDTASFADFAPGPTFDRLVDMVSSGAVIDVGIPNLRRIG